MNSKLLAILFVLNIDLNEVLAMFIQICVIFTYFYLVFI